MKVKENNKNGVGTSKRRSTTDVDHWAFLEEIDAPMWADLSLELKLLMEDNDDPWFQMSHPFHYHSARHLRSAFAHPDVGSDVGSGLFNFNVRGECSLPLPSSVSKSRGKDYRSRVCKSNYRKVSLDKGHPINDLGGRTLTNVLSQQHDSKVMVTPKDEFDHTDGLLNSLRNNLRKSHATRQASRIEISDDKEVRGHKSSSDKSCVGSSSTAGSCVMKGRESKGRTHSTGKSSVGSSNTCKDGKLKEFAFEQAEVEVKGNTRARGLKVSSGRPKLECSNPKSDVKKMDANLKLDKAERLEARDFKKPAKSINGRGSKKMSKASFSARNAYYPKILVGVPDAPSISQQAFKSKVLLQKTNFNQSRVAHGVKGKVGGNQFKCSGKENSSGRAVLSRNVGGKKSVPAATSTDSKSLKPKSKDKVRATSISSKVRAGSTTDGIMSLDIRVFPR